MKKTINRFIYLLGCLLTLNLATIAQEQKDSIKTRIETTDGNEYIGVVREQTSQSVRIKTDLLGEITIPAAAIKRMTEIGPLRSKDGTFWLDNPQATRYFWAPNGYNLKAGEGYYQNVWVLFNQAVVGLTDYFSAGVGVVPLFLFEGAPTPVWVTAKFSLPVVENKVNLGAGALMSTVVGGNTETSFGILYGISTFGSKDRNLNIGLGWGFADGEMAKNPTLNISGTIRTGARGYLITENYLIGTPDETLVIAMVGGRRIIKHVGLDFGVVMPFSSEIEGFYAIPWLGLTIPFGEASPSMER